MMSPYSNANPEKYSSYKNRFFNKYKTKARNLRNGINSLSLKDADKIQLKIELGKILNEASR